MFKVIFDVVGANVEWLPEEDEPIASRTRFATREEAHEALKEAGYQKETSEDWDDGDYWVDTNVNWSHPNPWGPFYVHAEVVAGNSKETCIW